MSKVSIIIPTYNSGKYLFETIDSVLFQTYPSFDIEVIIIDDGSRDDTKEILQKYKNKIIYIYQENKGPSAARNAGIKIAKGEYIAFLDADDVYEPEKIQKQAQLLEKNKDIGIVYCWRNFIDEDDNVLPQKGKVYGRGNLFNNLLEGSLFPSSVLMIRREIFDNVGLFDESLYTAEDWDFCLRAAKKGVLFDYVPEYLVRYRVYGKSVCDNYEKMEQNDLRLIDKAYSGLSGYDNLKRKAIFNILNEHAWYYFSKDDKEKGAERLEKAMQIYPEAFTKIENYLYLSRCMLPRGYRTNKEVYKNAENIEKVLLKGFYVLTLNGSVKDNIYPRLYLALGYIFYFARDMKKARSYFFKTVALNPFLILKPINFYTFLKSFLNKDIFIKIDNLKRQSSTKTIVYFLDIFPALSETFILNEILELERKGFDIRIFARKEENSLRHGSFNDLKAGVTYLPDSHKLSFKQLFFSHLIIFFSHPLNYVKTFFFCLNKRKDGSLWFFKVAGVYANLARKYRFSHIHSHFASLASCYAMLIGRLLGKPYSFTIHGIYDLYVAPPEDLHERAIFAKKAITISDYNKRYLMSKFNIPEEKIEVVHSGIDLNFFNENHREMSQDKIILSVARLDPVKSLDTLIKACDILNRERIDFKCLVIGEGKSRKELENLINKLSLGDRVSLLGAKKLEEVKGYYKKASIFVLPSKEETMGLSTIEAMASGLPVISTSIYGIPELVEHGTNGYLINPGDGRKLAEYLKELLQDENRCISMGKLGRKKIESQFNLNKEVNKLIEVFNDSN